MDVRQLRQIKSVATKRHKKHRRESLSVLCFLWLITRLALQQRLCLERLRSILVTERERSALVHCHSRILTFRIQDVKADPEAWQPTAIQQSLLDGVVLDPVQHFHACIFRVRAASHLLDDHERAEIEKIRFTTSG